MGFRVSSFLVFPEIPGRGNPGHYPLPAPALPGQIGPRQEGVRSGGKCTPHRGRLRGDGGARSPSSSRGRRSRLWGRLASLPGGRQEAPGIRGRAHQLGGANPEPVSSGAQAARRALGRPADTSCPDRGGHGVSAERTRWVGQGTSARLAYSLRGAASCAGSSPRICWGYPGVPEIPASNPQTAGYQP